MHACFGSQTQGMLNQLNGLRQRAVSTLRDRDGMDAIMASKLSQPGSSRGAKLDHHNVMRCLQPTTTDQHRPGVIGACRKQTFKCDKHKATNWARITAKISTTGEALLKAKLTYVVPSLRGTQVLRLQVGDIVRAWNVCYQDFTVL